MKSVSTALLAFTGLAAAASKYDEYILAPSSRTLHPKAVYQDKVNGTITGASSLAGDSKGSAVFSGISAVTYDFGVNIGGLVSLTVGNKTDFSNNQSIAITYSESSQWISGIACDATQDSGMDEALWFYPSGPGEVSVDRQHERGGFRYLSLIHNTTGDIEITEVTVEFTPSPTTDDLRNYTGFFHSDDELLNRIWYAGAYTIQMCAIDPKHGDALIHSDQINSSVPGDTVAPWPWYNNLTIANSSVVLVDGAKRDRLIWPGDMHVITPSLFVSISDDAAITNSIDNLFSLQNASGKLPYAGYPFKQDTYSATYHLYNLIGVADYYKFTDDLDYVKGKWDAWKLGLNFSLNFIDETGLMNVTSPDDWLRFGQGGHNIEANAILYFTINQGLDLASALNDSSIVTSWQNYASGIKAAANNLLWNETAGLYHDNETTTLMPQDGNSWAVLANLTNNATQASSISKSLAARWGPYGAPAVEADNAVSPFIGAFELEAHLLANNVSAALELMRLEWGFMLDDPRMTNSTFMEGYAFDGETHYAPYTNDPRISHAHGWSTGPTAFMTQYIAGIQLVSAGGRTWKIAPKLGDLKTAHAGFSTTVGSFEVFTNVTGNGDVSTDFSTPVGTSGGVAVPYPPCAGIMTIHEVKGRCKDVILDVQAAEDRNGDIEVEGLIGGDWELRFSCAK
ncbi:bacterial alpha-L-rhamnosidase domain-containing protein [Aureobasidium pullulans]|uniref:Bacterial alpha-L-rhamnosidase domain-containing protein n=1 Tax=Aureobasidium pullulans TaxID=5580 RepID=A0A4S9EPL5_AURPU|nr:bacterial alpha-L-rhamnosidase domain-containing protein [Aureobasidium pullulans]